MTFGIGGFGLGGFGGGGVGGGVLSCDAIAVLAENRVRLTFSKAIYFSGVGDAPDAAVASKYTLAADATTTGADGEPARAVSICAVELSPLAEVGSQFGSCVDLLFDRAMSPYPARYSVSVNGVMDANQTVFVIPVSFAFDAVHMELTRPDLTVPRRARDFAFPPLTSPANDTGLVATGTIGVPSPVGTYRSNGRGDYAYDEGVIGLKKRVLRRLITRPGGYAHLGSTYGVGIPMRLKKLATALVIQQITAEAEKQIAEEPDVAKVRVTSTIDASHNLVRFVILIRTVSGQAVSLTPSFRTAA